MKLYEVMINIFEISAIVFILRHVLRHTESWKKFKFLPTTASVTDETGFETLNNGQGKNPIIRNI